MKLGFSGKLTRATIGSPLPPLFLMAAVVFGLVAVIAIAVNGILAMRPRKPGA